MVPMDIKSAVSFYISEGYRPMPLFSVEEKCKHRPYKPELDCKGQCWGKVPMIEHWPDNDIYTADAFPNNANVALIMGKQRDGRWLVGFDLDGELELEQFIFLPPTLECKTKRGKHFIYEVEPDTPLGNWNDILGTRSKTFGYKLDYKGALDIKYCRGAMASPPSQCKDGSLYIWNEWIKPTQLPYSEIQYIIRRRKSMHPSVKRYSTWSKDPMHFNKKP